MKRSTVLIVSDEESFRHALERRWKAEPAQPVLASADGDLEGVAPEGCELAVVGPLRKERLPAVLAALDSPQRAVLCFVAAQPARAPLRKQFPRVRFLHLDDDCADLAVVLADEILRRLDATARLRRAEQAGSGSQGSLAVGRSIREMRHDINNALTSVLGNAELLLLDGDSLSAQAREQAETIRTHALHMHEIMQRLSSLEAEVKFAGNRSGARPAGRTARK